MSVTTIIPTAVTPSTTAVTDAPVTTTSPTGLASTASTLSSSDQNTVSPPGITLCAKIRIGFFLACDAVSHTLLQLPLIGSLLAKNARLVAAADRHLVHDMCEVFAKAARSTTSPIPSSDDVTYMLHWFNKLRTPAAKMNAFTYVIFFNNSTDDIARQFYATLPVDMQNEFKRQIWLANEQQDNGHGIGYGDYVVNHEIRGDIALAAAADAEEYYIQLSRTPVTTTS